MKKKGVCNRPDSTSRAYAREANRNNTMLPPMIAAQCAGMIRRCMDESSRYAKERKTFGKPIAEHQAVQFMIAEMAMAYETTRLLYSKAAWEVDNDIKRTITSAVAKCMGADLAVKSATDAVQVFGGYGYTREYPVERYMRDAKVMQIVEGTNQIQRLVIARHLRRTYGTFP